jgi:diguanylate cyclase (GGDEF)-like protein
MRLPLLTPLMRTGFRQQLVLTFTIGILLLAVVSSLAISELSSRTVRDKLIEEGRQATESLAAQSTLALLYRSADNAKDAVQATLAFPDIIGVAIYDPQHKVLVSEGEEALPDGVDATWPQVLQLERETEHAWYFFAPVYTGRAAEEGDESPFETSSFEPQLIGYVRLVMGKETLHTMAGDILRGNLIVSVALASLLLLLLLMITTRLTRPLKDLADTMRKAEEGDKLVRAELHGPRDIVHMESAFNTMMGVLEGREQDLERARDSALESARLKGEFAANVSHELRTPLNGVLGMLELLENMGLTHKQREYVEVARNSGASLLALIDDILDFSKVEVGKLKLDPADFNLLEVLDEVVAVLAGQAQRKNLDVGYVIARDAPVVIRGDSGRLRQVLINLAGNAVKFTEQGEVAIDVRLDEVLPDTKLLLRFEVRDTGIGISHEAQQNIFKAFAQADGSTTRKYGGTGLGLAISRQLTELMGGEIGVESEPGMGSTFWFNVLVEQAVQKVPQSESRRNEFAGLRILIVDDSSVNRRFLEQKLSAWGMYHNSIKDGLHAVEMLHSAAAEGRPYDLILLDELMPGIKGAELGRQIAKDPTIARIKVILMTNQPLEFDGDQLPGIAGYLAKPVRESVLYERIASIIRQPLEGKPDNLAEEEGQVVPQPGSRILVVDDNQANQQVAIGMLERLGCRVDIAASGEEAIEAVGRGSYSLVLMDCQMPGMDGYEATARIRAMEGGESHLPIVALTANVREGDNDKCLAAGMDDYLPKPLKLDVLRAKLQQWVIPQSDEPMAAHAAAGNGRIDREVFSELRESVGETFSKIIEYFLEDTPVSLRAMHEAVASRNAQVLADSAHSVKGSAMNFGANKLANLCRKLEELGRSGSIDGATELLQSVASEYEMVKSVLRHEVEPDKGSPLHDNKEQSRVLIVDDDRGMRIALRDVLENDGYQIQEAADGAQAVAICERSMPDLVLMDAVMPLMDGFTACARIRAMPSAKNIPVMIITALEDEHSIERAFKSGATDYIPKPVHFSVLRQRVARMVTAGRAEKRIRRLAYHDGLTGLANRASFHEYLEEQLERARPDGEMLAVLFLDLDRFKIVNDTLGHDVGDLLLKAVADRLLRCVRGGDLVARLGGDEFTVVLDDIRSSAVVSGVAGKICNALSKPFAFMGREVYVTTSIGIALYPADGRDVGTLTKRADTAMFSAKEQGSKYQFYEHDMESAIVRRLEVDSDLRKALVRNELVVYYQPQADLKTGDIVGIEALVRWQHPEQGLIPPSEFIPVAEETGLIEEVGEWVLRHACAQLQSWQQQGFPPMRVAVNLSGRQLENEGLAECVKAVLDETGLPPNLLELEITESSLMKRTEDVVLILHRLKEMGIKLAIDDFGTGHSSLSYLKRFPIDMLKIDRSFVSDLTINSDDSAIITAIIALARSLQLKVIAEGVETKEQKTFLIEQGCDLMQGYYLSKPMPADVFERQFLNQGKGRSNEPASKVSPFYRKKDRTF